MATDPIIEMDGRRWEDLNMDCLVKVFGKVGMESLLLDVPVVCKSWYKATLNPSCWQALIFPDNELTDVWPWDGSQCPNFENLMDRFAGENQIDKNCFSITAFIKFVINRSKGNVTLLKLPKCCTAEAFEFAADVCPNLATLSLPGNLLTSDMTNCELIGKWKNLEVLSLGGFYDLKKILAPIRMHCKKFHSLDLSKTSVHEREALEIVKLVPNIKFLNLKGAKVGRDFLVPLLRGCKDLVVLDARDCLGFDVGDDEISKLASHISNFMCEGSEDRFGKLKGLLMDFDFVGRLDDPSYWSDMIDDINAEWF